MSSAAVPVDVKAAEEHLMRFLSVEGVTGQEEAIAAAVIDELKKVGVPASAIRFDTVNMNMDKPAYIFSAVTARLVLRSHFLSSESIYLQYSRYIYGDKMGIAAKWPWGTPVVQGSDVIQTKVAEYTGMTPDENVVKLQATIAF